VGGAKRGRALNCGKFRWWVSLNRKAGSLSPIGVSSKTVLAPRIFILVVNREN